MAIPKIKRIAHIVLYVSDPQTSAQWYAEVLGMQRVAQVPDGPYKGGIFLSFGESDHDIALFKSAGGATQGAEFEHIGLELECGGDLDALRRLYGKMLKHNVRIHEILDHGVSIGIYFFDPDGHLLEVLCQLVGTTNGASIAELARNQGQANPIQLKPSYE